MAHFLFTCLFYRTRNRPGDRHAITDWVTLFYLINSNVRYLMTGKRVDCSVRRILKFNTQYLIFDTQIQLILEENSNIYWLSEWANELDTCDSGDLNTRFELNIHWHCLWTGINTIKLTCLLISHLINKSLLCNYKSWSIGFLQLNVFLSLQLKWGEKSNHESVMQLKLFDQKIQSKPKFNAFQLNHWQETQMIANRH